MKMAKNKKKSKFWNWANLLWSNIFLSVRVKTDKGWCRSVPGGANPNSRTLNPSLSISFHIFFKFKALGTRFSKCWDFFVHLLLLWVLYKSTVKMERGAVVNTHAIRTNVDVRNVGHWTKTDLTASPNKTKWKLIVRHRELQF